MSKTLKAGIFVVLAIVTLIIGWIWLAKIEFKKKGIEIIIHFPDVTGLKINDPVKVWGIEKGRVKNIEFTNEYIRVTAMVDKEVKIYTDASAGIYDVAMISGTKYVDLDPGKSGILLPEGTPIPGKPSIGLPIVTLTEIGKKIDNLIGLATEVKIIYSLGEILKNLQESTYSLAQLIKESHSDIKATVKSLKEGSEEIELMSKKITSATDNLDSLLSEIRKGEGTLGKLLNDDSLYNQLNSTLQSIKELADDIKTNPRKYIKIF